MPPPPRHWSRQTACAQDITQQVPGVTMPNTCLEWDYDYFVSGHFGYYNIREAAVQQPCRVFNFLVISVQYAQKVLNLLFY